MEEKKTFSQLLNAYHQKIITIFCLKQLQKLIGFIAISFASILIISRFILIVEWKALLLVASILSCVSIAYKTYQQWPSLVSSVKKYNSRVNHDYVLTTFELKESHPNYSTLLHKTVELMKKNHSTIMKTKEAILNKKWLSITFFCLIIASISYTFPSETQVTATKQSETNQLIKETKEELEQLKELTENKEKQELIDTAIEELTKIKELDQLTTQLEKLNEELNLQLLKDFEKMELLRQLASQSSTEWEAVQDALKNQQWTELKEALSQMDLSNLTKSEQTLVEKLQSLNLTEEELKQLLENKWDQQLATELNDLGKKVAASANEIDPSQLISYEGTIAQGPKNENSSPPSDSSTNQGNQPSQPNANQGNTNNSNPGTTNQGNSNNSNPGSSNEGNQSTNKPSNGNTSEGNGSTNGTNGGNAGGAGAGIGTGQGNRELTLPTRILTEHSIEIDGGILNEGQPGVRLEVKGLAEKGQINEYEKVLNVYDTINQNALDKLTLPSSLSELVKNYFSTTK